ncbi:MAG: MBL fold metallo-hydrolase [Pseudomonadales bacterium]|nr:MBL fold metallo-hydrolase [Pseudomonadales bacterium]
MNAQLPINQFKILHATGATLTRFGEVPNFNEGLYELGKGAYAWMVPNGSWGETNCGLIVGDGESVLIDTLWDLPYTRQMMSAIEPIVNTAPINTVVNTHSDGDHFWGNQLFPNRDIIATQACKDMMHHISPKSMTALGKVGAVASKVPVFGANKIGNWFSGMVKPYDYSNIIITPANKTFTQELTLNVGGREVVLMEMGPAHTSGDAMVYLPDSKLLYTGDLLFIDSTPPLWAGPVENWITAIDRMLEMDVDIFVPGHGALTDRQGVIRVKDYWEFIYEEVSRRNKLGMPPAEIAREILFGSDIERLGFLKWDSPERLFLSTHVLCKHLNGEGDKHQSTPEVFSILSKQGKLAHELPLCRPRCMHRLKH